jgi:hypothetical protein
MVEKKKRMRMNRSCGDFMVQKNMCWCSYEQEVMNLGVCLCFCFVWDWLMLYSSSC